VTHSEARKLLEVYLYQNWVDTPIAWENVEGVEFDETGTPPLAQGQDQFISLDIFVHTSQAITVPGSCIRYPGTLEFAIFTKEGTGARASTELLDDLIALFEYKTLKDEISGTIRVRNITTSVKYHNGAGWYVTQAGFAFYFERFVPNP
jgi:hypothetical protein